MGCVIDCLPVSSQVITLPCDSIGQNKTFLHQKYSSLPHILFRLSVKLDLGFSSAVQLQEFKEIYS